MRNQNVLTNSRIIPCEEELLTDKKFNIELFAYLQIRSKFTKGDAHRYIRKSNLFYKEISKAIGYSVQTIKKDIEYLEVLGLIEECEYGTDRDGTDITQGYYKIKNKFKRYLLFASEFIEKLISLKIKNLVKVYLIYYCFSNIYGKCQLCQEGILIKIGLSGKSNNNKEKITKINNVLKDMGLIYIEVLYEKNSEDKVGRKSLIITAHIYYETKFYKEYTLENIKEYSKKFKISVHTTESLIKGEGLNE